MDASVPVKASPTAAPVPASGQRPHHRQRRATACERCNKKRVKCDASVVGLPCSSCRNAKHHECRFIRSKRTRGSAGRFINPQEDDKSQGVGDDLQISPSAMEQTPQKQSEVPATRTAHDPQFSLNLEKLYGEGGMPVIAEVSGRDTISTRNVAAGAYMRQGRKRRETRPAFVGESWFASYLANTATTGHMDLHQPVEVTENTENRTRSVSPQVENPTEMNTAQPSNCSPMALTRDLPPDSLQRLIESYFSRFHVYFPILDKSSFLSSVEDGTVSATLLRSVLFVGSTQCDPAIYHLLGFSTRNDTGDELFALAKKSFDSDNTSDRTAMLQSAFLLHYWWGQPTAFKDSLWWLATAIRSAQCMGMHRSTRGSKISRKTQILWRRIWWCLYIRDRQLALIIGVPMVINELECNADDLTLDDFPDESLETANYVINQIGLNKAASKMFFCHCTPLRVHLSADPGTRYLAQRDVQTTLEAWHDSLPRKSKRDRRHYLSLTLEMCYSFMTINLQQRLQGQSSKSNIQPEDSDIILDAANNITRLVEDAMIYWSPEYFPMMWVTAIFAAMNIQYFAYLRKNRQDRELALVKLRPSLIALKQFEQCYIVARWIRILWTDILDRSNRKTRAHEHQVAVSEPNSNTSLPMTSAQQQQTQFISPDQTPSILYDRSSQMAESEYVSDERSEMSPYPVADWSSLFSLDGYDAPADLPLPNTLEYHSLQFLANLGSIGYT